MAIFCPEADIKPGDSRVAIGVIGLFFLVPACVGTVYAFRSMFRSHGKFAWLRYAWIAMAVLPTLLSATVARFQWVESRRYLAEGKEARGRILETHPEDHNTLLVAYDVGGVEYRTKTQGPNVARSYRPGETIAVYYFTTAPNRGFCVEPKWRPDLILLGWILGSGVLPVWMLGALAAVGRRLPKHRLALQAD